METNIVHMFKIKEGYNIAIKGFIPDKDNPAKGEIILMGNPIKCVRRERYSLEGDTIFTESWNLHVSFLVTFLMHAGSVNEDGSNVVIQEVLPKGYVK